MKRLPVVVIILAACSSNNTESPPGPTVCTMEARAGIVVEPVDAATGRPVAGTTTVIAREGAYADSASADVSTMQQPATIGAAYERKGTYNVTVRNPAYRPFETSVTVTADACHVIPQRIRASLTRSN